MLKDDYLRSIVFGLQDALVSTTGVVIGLSLTLTGNSQLVLLASVITVAVEAISMGAGQYISEQAVHDFQPRQHQDSVMISSWLMFVSYVVGGAIPIWPLMVFNYPVAPVVSGLMSILAFAAMGYAKSRITHTGAVRSIITIILVGGIAAAIGAVVGIVTQKISGQM